jgi:hypothetical protein
MKLQSFLLLLIFGCTNKTDKKQENSQQLGQFAGDSDSTNALCRVDRSKGGVVDYPYVHLADAKGQKLLVFGYAQVDLGFAALKGVLQNEKVLAAPAQKMAIVVDPEDEVLKKITKQMRNTSCVVDVEKSMVYLMEQFQNTIYLSVETPPLDVFIKAESASFCDMHVEKMKLTKMSDFDKVNLKVTNARSTWWGPVGKWLTEGLVTALKNTAIVTGNEGNLQEIVLSQMSEAFDKDMLLTVKKSLGCRL